MRACPYPGCGRRLFVFQSGVYHCPKGHQTSTRGHTPVVRLTLGKIPATKRWWRRLFR